MRPLVVMPAADASVKPPQPVSIDRYGVTVHDTFESLIQVAQKSGSDDAEDDLFHTADWFKNLLRNGMAPDTSPLLCWVSTGEDSPGFCLPLMHTPRAAAALGGPALLAFSNYYSCVFGPIGSPQAVTLNACRALVRHLRYHHSLTVLDLQPLATDATLHGLLLDALRAEGYFADSYFCFGNWHLPVADRDFATYFPAVPSKLRNTIKRGRKKLDSEGTGAWELAIHQQPGPALDAAIADFVAVYGQSWKTAEPFPQFIPGLCATAATRGWLRLGVVRLHGQPIAAQLWLVRKGRALIYKLAYDEAFKRYSAGSVLSAALMQHAIDADGVVDIDYLTGDDAYKQDWMTHRRLRHGIVAFRRLSLRGALGAARHFGGRWARHWRGQPTQATLAPGPTAIDRD